MKNKIYLLKNPVNLAFLISVIYWIYLVLSSRMLILFDALNYESLGNILMQKGWVEFFKIGPNREPFYPMLVALSMMLGNFFGLSYQLIQTLIQFLILFLTQFMTLRILRLLKINNQLSALTILYLGISPAIVNSALSLYSEIATYPFILAIMLLIYKSWVSFSGPRLRVFLLAIVTSLLFVIMILNKGIFELVTPIFLFLLLVSAFSTRDRKLIINFLMYLVVFIVIFYSSVNSYKSVNKIFNGCFTVTDRGSGSLYGETVLRMKPLLANNHLLISLVGVPGENVGKFLFARQGDHYSPDRNSPAVGDQNMVKLRNGGMSEEAINNALVLLSIKEALRNPAQYVLFTAIEGSKMFFWESTQIGYVVYPVGLTRLFSWTFFKNALRLGMSLLTLFSFFYLTVLFLRQRQDILKKENPLLFLYLCFLFIFSFVGPYSLFWIITRYFLPLTPLYLITITYVFQRIYLRCKSKIEI